MRTDNDSEAGIRCPLEYLREVQGYFQFRLLLIHRLPGVLHLLLFFLFSVKLFRNSFVITFLICHLFFVLSIKFFYFIKKIFFFYFYLFLVWTYFLFYAMIMLSEQLS